MSIIHDFIRVANDGVGKRVGNVVQTDPDADEVYLQKTVTADPEDATDAGLQRVTDGRAHTQQRAEVTDDATATWTSATALNTTLDLDVSGLATAVIQVARTGTITQGTVGFKASADGALWTEVYARPASGSSVTNYHDLAGVDLSYVLDVAAMQAVRLELLTDILGAGSAALRLGASAAPSSRVQAVVTGDTDLGVPDLYMPPVKIGGRAHTFPESVGYDTRVDAWFDLEGRLITGSDDGADVAIGSTTDAEATGNGSLIAIAKRLRTLLSGGLPAALGAGGGLKVDGSGTALPVSGTMTINAIPAGTNNIGDVDVLTVPADPFGANADAAVAAGATGSLSAKLRAISRDLVANIVLAAGANIIGKVGIDQTTPGTTNLVAAGQSGTWTVQPGNTANTTAWKVDGSAVTQPVKEARAATATLTNVNDTASNTTLLASNANRLGATIHNDSTAVLYVKLGATASATSFTVKMSAGAYYEVPFNYTGIIDGIWASDASGAARITELSA